MEIDTNSLLLITGGMGSGKTSILAEASDLLALRRIAHASIDLDALGLAFLPSAASRDDAMYANLRAVCKNYARLGVDRFLVARAVEDQAELEICRHAVSATDVVVCRLVSSDETMLQRVEERETGTSRVKYIARATEPNLILDRARLEDFKISNENRSLTEVAFEMLVRAAWISSDPPLTEDQ